MKFPARFIAGNLIWTREATVWAVWRITPASYPYRSNAQKLRQHANVRSALISLPAESMLLSLCRRIDPYEIGQAMAAGVELDERPAWRRRIRQTVARLEQTNPFDRVRFIAVQLPDQGGKKKALADALDAARVGVGEAFGLTAPPVKASEVESRRRQAGQLEAQLRGPLDVRAATPAEIRWIYARAPRRGLDEPYLDPTWEPTNRVIGEGPEARMAGPTLTTLGDGIFKEGGLAADPNRPRHRRYLRVETEAGVGYQSFLALSDMPHRFRFPDGAEWLYALDAVAFPVDWCARIRAVPNRDAQLKVRRKARELVGQAAEYEGEPAGPPRSLAEATEAIDDLRAELSSNSDPELQASFIFATWADDLPTLEEQVGVLRAMYQSSEYDLHRPTGGQSALFAAMLPGVSERPAMRDYVQYLLPKDLASAMPFATAEVGDPGGMLLGYSLDGGTFRPVLFDPGYGPSRNASGSLLACGDLGSGKSWHMKGITVGTIERGGQVVALDRAGEYVRLAKALNCRSEIVDIEASSELCLDPLRVFKGPEAIDNSLGFLTLLAGVAPQDLQGLALEEAIREVARRPNPRLRDVIAVLGRTAPEDPDARIVYRKLSTYAENELGRLAFGDGEVLCLDADFIVFHTPGLDLPTRDELQKEHLFKRLTPRKIISQALLYLVAAVTRRVICADIGRFSAAEWDEVWAITSFPQGKALADETLRESRRKNAALWVATQRASDLGDATLAELIPNRFLFRHDHGAAETLQVLGMEVTERAVEALSDQSEETNGRCLYQDLRKRIGYIQVLGPADAELQAAMDTNPITRHQRETAARADTGGSHPGAELGDEPAPRRIGQVAAGAGVG